MRHIENITIKKRQYYSTKLSKRLFQTIVRWSKTLFTPTFDIEPINFRHNCCNVGNLLFYDLLIQNAVQWG